MQDFEINITPTGISVSTTQTRRMIDESTGLVEEVPIGKYRKAAGIGDFKNADAFRARVTELCLPVLGEEMAHLTALAASACSERDAAIAEKNAAVQAAKQALKSAERSVIE